MQSFVPSITSLVLPRGFVALRGYDPSFIIDARYAQDINFVGKAVRGYDCPEVVATVDVAEALCRVQERVEKDGFALVIYDAYRPQQAVDHFWEWSQNHQDNRTKELFYPRINKEDAFSLGYMAKRSSHSRGAAVDLTLIEMGKSLTPPQKTERSYQDHSVIAYLDDGTVDMGSSFDMLDMVSHVDSPLVTAEILERRHYLQRVMMACGFIGYSKEWWHFQLAEEPFPKTYFNFPIAPQEL